MASPLPKTKEPAFVKNSRICSSTCWSPEAVEVESARSRATISAAAATPATRQGDGRPRTWPCAHEQHEQTRKEKQRGELCTGPGGRHQHDHEDRPEQGITLVRSSRQSIRGDGDDGDDDRADAVEHGLHPRHPTVGHVQRAQAEDHEKRRENERQANESRAHDAALEVSNRHGRLGGERTGHDLRKRDRQVVGGLVDQLPILDEVASHVTDKRRRAAETERSEFEEIPDEVFH